MYIVFGVTIGLIIANKLVGIHMYCKLCEQATLDELKIIKWVRRWFVMRTIIGITLMLLMIPCFVVIGICAREIGKVIEEL